MIILDSNVLSELMRPQPEARVIAWLDRQPQNVNLDNVSYNLRNPVRIAGYAGWEPSRHLHAGF